VASRKDKTRSAASAMSKSKGGKSAKSASSARRPVRYAVIGLGHIAQIAVLPAFAHARKNSELCALISDDEAKLRKLGRRYGVAQLGPYAQYEELLDASKADAVYIALPNVMHREYTERAARLGVHVLCEKPLAADPRDCDAMVRVAEERGIQLMTAYRLHFDPANLEAVKLARSGRLGELRAFASTFTMQVKAGNSRLDASLGGGPLLDIGIYCINAARMLFGAEPVEVLSAVATSDDDRFSEVPEMASAVLRFPGHRLATFTCSFGAADSSAYDLIGTRGRLRLDPAYEHSEALVLHTQIGSRKQRRVFPKQDQFARELLYFSQCVREGRKPQPSGLEGWIDVAIIDAIRAAARRRASVVLDLPSPAARPEPSRAFAVPAPIAHAETIHVDSPSS
jgi:predicted dehydrogenase